MRVLVITFGILLCVGCQPTNGIRNPSLFQVIDDPKDFEETQIRVSGYLQEGVNYYLYLTKGHAIMDDTSSAIRVEDFDFKDTSISFYCEGYAEITATLISWTPKRHSNQAGFYYLKAIQSIIIHNEDGTFNYCWDSTKHEP